MTPEELTFAALEHLVEGRVYPDVAPEGEPIPYITYQAVGGTPESFLSGDRPNKQPVRMQVNCWAAGRIEASSIGKQIEGAMYAAVHLQPTALTGRTATYDETTKRRGTMQDFEIYC